MFYQSPKNLGTGLHTLQIALQSAGNYWLDYIVIDGNASSISVMDNTTTPTTITSIEGTHTQPAYSEQPLTLSSTITTSATPVHSNKASDTIIISGILGGLLGVVLLLCFVWLILRRTSKRSDDAESTLTPYTTNSFDLITGARTTQTGFSEVSSRPIFTTQSLPKRTHREAVPVPNAEPPPLYCSPQISEESYMRRGS
jgi:hypothetical protein